MKQNPYYSFSSLIHSFVHSCILPGWSKALQLLGIWDWWENLSGDEPCKDHDAHFSSQTCHHLQVGLHFSVYFPLDLDVGDKKWVFGEVNWELNCEEFLTRWEVIDKDSSLEEGALFPRLRSGCPIRVERVQLPNINRIEQLGHWTLWCFNLHWLLEYALKGNIMNLQAISLLGFVDYLVMYFVRGMQ